MVEIEAKTFQHWRGMNGATAYHLIERHADGWPDISLMMEAWLAANTEALKDAISGLLRFHQEGDDGAELPREYWSPGYREAVECAEALVGPNVDGTGPCLHGSGGQQGSAAPEPSSGD